MIGAIGIVVDGLARGGAERQAILSVAALRCLGEEARLYVLSELNHYASLLEELDVPVQRVCGRPGKVKRLLWLARAFGQDNVQLVHSFKRPTNLGAWAATQLSPVRWLVAGLRNTPPNRAAVVAEERIVSAVCNGWVVNSESIKNGLVRRGCAPNRVAVVRNAVHLEPYQSEFLRLSRESARSRLRLPEGRFVIAMVASFGAKKNHRLALRAISEQPDLAASALLVLAGEGPEVSRVREQAADLGIQNNILFLGRTDEVFVLLRAADVSIVPSLVEGFPNVVLESMIAGVPVVVNGFSGADEIVRNGVTGTITKYNDVKDFSRALLKIRNEPQRALRLAQAGKTEASKRFGLEGLGQELREVYRRVVTKQGLASPR